MTIWEAYPATYRSTETGAVLSAVRAGECAAVLGLSGSGKSNLLTFLVNRVLKGGPNPPGRLVDCNRLEEPSAAGFYHLLQTVLGAEPDREHNLPGLETAVQAHLSAGEGRLCLLFDRFDALPEPVSSAIAGSLRALRDEHKYALTYVIAARRPPDPHQELAELFFASTLWLGPLAEADAGWSVAQFGKRRSQDWSPEVVDQLVQLSGGYPAWLRACCEAYAAGASLDLESLRQHPAVRQRLAEFWADAPSPEALASSRLTGIPLASSVAAPLSQDLTAKEQLLLAYFQAHAGLVCEKDDLIRAAWPEDRVFSRGVRDDSLAQLVRRLREKVEPDPSAPRRILTVAGRGYRYK